jgi:hypothetical protein
MCMCMGLYGIVLCRRIWVRCIFFCDWSQRYLLCDGGESRFRCGIRCGIGV